MPSVAERIATTLNQHTTQVFGLMGNGNAHLIDAMLRLTELQFTPVRHEAATVASADAYYRATRELAVATTTYGAGFTNTLTALTEAAMSRTPLLLVVGDAPTTGLRPWDIDQESSAAASGVPTIVVSAETPGADTEGAIRRALTERIPVVLSIPYDLPTMHTDEPATTEPLETAAPLVTASAQEIAEVGQLLQHAARPLILAGRGSLEARAELRELADRLGAITVTTAPARGMFAGREMDAGVCGGFSSERTLEYVGQADAILAVGASLNQFTMGFGRIFAPDAALMQVDVLDEPTHPNVTHFVNASAKSAVGTLLAEITPNTETWAGTNPAEVSAAQFSREDADAFAADGKLDPRALTSALDKQLPAERLIVSDGGHFIGWANTHLRVPGPDSILLVGTQFQSIGLGFASAPGAAIAANQSDRMLVVVTGDGGGLMALADLDSVARTAHRATIVVYNDAAYTAEVTQYGTLGLDERPMLIEQVNFAKFAEGVGARGTVVNTPEDLDEWAAWAAGDEPGTWLLDCRISGEVIAPYQLEIMENLKRKVAAEATA